MLADFFFNFFSFFTLFLLSLWFDEQALPAMLYVGLLMFINGVVGIIMVANGLIINKRYGGHGDPVGALDKKVASAASEWLRPFGFS